MADWEHLSLAIFAIFDVKELLKLLAMVFDQYLTCLIFPLRWAYFPKEIVTRHSGYAYFRWISMAFYHFISILV